MNRRFKCIVYAFLVCVFLRNSSSFRRSFATKKEDATPTIDKKKGNDEATSPPASSNSPAVRDGDQANHVDTFKSLRTLSLNNNINTTVCTLKKPVLRSCENNTMTSCPQVYAASYPGSGAELFRAVVEAISGYTASEVYKKKDLHRHFLIKTHSPMLEKWANKLMVEPKNAIYLMRNPLYSLPSYFNWLYESNHNLPDHSTQAPLDDWLQWRKKNFDKEFTNWLNHVQYWANNNNNETNVFVIPYEGLTAYDTGPQWAYRVGKFLEDNTRVPVATPNATTCLWDIVVKGGKSKKRGAKKYTPNFSASQLTQMEDGLERLQQRFAVQFPVLGEILEGYVKAVQERRAGME